MSDQFNEKLLEALNGGRDAWDVLNSEAGENNPRLQTELFDIRKAYARCFSTSDGKAVLEDLRNKTQKASVRWPSSEVIPTMEQCTAYGLMRDGQNALFASIETAIQDGGRAIENENSTKK